MKIFDPIHYRVKRIIRKHANYYFILIFIFICSCVPPIKYIFLCNSLLQKKSIEILYDKNSQTRINGDSVKCLKTINYSEISEKSFYTVNDYKIVRSSNQGWTKKFNINQNEVVQIKTSSLNIKYITLDELDTIKIRDDWKRFKRLKKSNIIEKRGFNSYIIDIGKLNDTEPLQ